MKFSTLWLPGQGVAEVDAKTGGAGIPCITREAYAWIPLETARRIADGDPEIVQVGLPETDDAFLVVPGFAPGFGTLLVVKRSELPAIRETFARIVANTDDGAPKAADGGSTH